MTIVSLLGLIVIGYSRVFVSASSNLGLQIASSEEPYKLGEPVPIELRISNQGSDIIYLSEDSVERIEIQISSDDRIYKKYSGPGLSFTLDGAGPMFKISPNGDLKRQKTILFNFVSHVSHLNVDAAKPVLEGRILTDYALPKSGTYFIKAVLEIKDGKPMKVESEPVKVVISDPVGEDLEVWNKIKDSGDIAYLIQEGDILIPSYKAEEQKKFQQEVEGIIRDYPNSFYAQSLQSSLDKFRASEAKRQEFMQKLKKQKPQ